jgi:hypothetical protein
MSLKAFHIIFIIISALIAFGFSGWLIDGYTKSWQDGQLIAGICSALAGMALIVYGIRFLRKLKHVSFL